MINFTEEDYKSGRVNLHIHSNLSDGRADFREIVRSAERKGFKAISITDHNTFDGHKLVKSPILIPGAEFDCWCGYVFIHLLAYDFDINNEALNKFTAENKSEIKNNFTRLFAKRNVKDLISAIHNASGIAVLAHPACYWAVHIEDLIKKLISFGLDGIEVYYPYKGFRKAVKFRSEKSIQKLADRYPELIKTGGTDFHGIKF